MSNRERALRTLWIGALFVVSAIVSALLHYEYVSVGFIIVAFAMHIRYRSIAGYGVLKWLREGEKK